MIVNKLLESAEKFLKGKTVEDVVIGLGYSAVKLDDGSCGLAATLREEIDGCCDLVERAGELAGCSATALGELILSTNTLDSTIGLATINASINRDIKSNTASVIEALEISRDSVAGMVGYFGPLVAPIRQQCQQLYVFERHPPDKEFVYPDWAVNILLPQCDIVIISGTTLITKTIDHLLELCQGKVAILGPSTPLSPIVKKWGVSFVFGVTVKDADKVLKIVSQAGGARAFGKAVEKINLKW